MNFLDIGVPVIAAINGPGNMHSEIPLMSDVVLASEDTWFDDRPHFPRGVVPEDGQHIWQRLIGPVRASYFLTQNIERPCIDEQGHGIWNEPYAQRQVYPVGGGTEPFQNAWDDPNPFGS